MVSLETQNRIVDFEDNYGLPHEEVEWLLGILENSGKAYRRGYAQGTEDSHKDGYDRGYRHGQQEVG
jgi:flagellar biosynthesis/type III secretory pathway protein FliH